MSAKSSAPSAPVYDNLSQADRSVVSWVESTVGGQIVRYERQSR